MKKIALMMMALAATLSFVSCDSTETEYATNADYATVVGTMPVTLVTDSNQTLIVADCATEIGTYSPAYGQRALIYFSPLQSADGKLSNQIKLYGYMHFDDSETAMLAEGEETDYGQYEVDIYRDYTGSYYLVHATKSVIDVVIASTGTRDKVADHGYTLVLDEDEPVVDGYLSLTLAHETTEAESSVTTYIFTPRTFDLTMAPFADYIEGTTGVRITAKGLGSKGPVVHQFTWAN